MTTTSEPRLSTGAWREGDPAGDRRFVSVGAVELEAGGRLPEVTVAYETWGTLNPARDNAILVEHALTGDSHVSGPAGPGHATPGWWDGLIGPGCPFDTDTHFIVAANVLGGCQGTTGPSSTAPDGRAWGSRFPFVTIRDQVQVEALLADLLGIRPVERRARRVDGRHARAGVGGHPPRPGGDGDHPGVHGLRHGGADRVVPAPAARHPQRPRSSTAATTTSTARARRPASASPGASPTSPTAASSSCTTGSGALPQGAEQPLGGGGRYAVESYLDHHAGKIGGRFDANSYLVLTEAMNSHDVGRDRGGVRGRTAAGDRAARGGRRRLRPALPAAALRRDRRGSAATPSPSR